MKNQFCRNSIPKLLVLLIVVFSQSIMAQAQKVVIVLGEVNGPQQLKDMREKATLRPGDIVDVPADSLVIVEYSWRSDVAEHPCARWDYVKGRAMKVAPVKQPGTCPIERNPTDCNSPQCMTNGSLYFYEDAKEDDPNMSERVRQSVKQRKQFEDALRKMRARTQTDRVPQQI